MTVFWSIVSAGILLWLLLTEEGRGCLVILLMLGTVAAAVLALIYVAYH